MYVSNNENRPPPKNIIMKFKNTEDKGTMNSREERKKLDHQQ